MTEDTNTQTQANPQQEDAAALMEPPSGGRIHFGRLTIHATRVRPEGGHEGYSIEGLTDFNGLPVTFKGNAPDAKSRTVHVVPVLTKTDKDGADFTIYQNMYSSSLEYKRVFLKAVTAMIPNFTSIVNTGAVVFVRLEETPFNDFYPSGADENKTTYIDREGKRKDRTIWKVAENYPSPDALKAASDEFFAQFKEGEDGGAGESDGLGAAPGSYNVDGWAGMTDGIADQFNESGDAVKVATDYAFIDDVKAAVINGFTAPQIAEAWGLPVPLVASVVGS